MIEVKFQSKPIPVPLIYQPVYKIIMLLIILKYGTKKKKASLLTLNVFFWSIRTDENHKVLLDIAKRRRDKMIPWNFEPGLDKTINLAIVGGYCSKNKVEVQLETAGEELLDRVERLGVFKEDIDKVKLIGKISISRLEKSVNNWDLN